MQYFVGTKLIQAEPEIKTNPGGQVSEGYRVVYSDGYESWSPKDIFEEAYMPSDAVSFGHALKMLKDGYRVARSSWPDGMFLYFVPGSNFKVNRAPLLGIYEEGTPINYLPHIDKRTMEGNCTVWNPSQEDLFATWRIIGL